MQYNICVPMSGYQRGKKLSFCPLQHTFQPSAAYNFLFHPWSRGIYTRSGFFLPETNRTGFDFQVTNNKVTLWYCSVASLLLLLYLDMVAVERYTAQATSTPINSILLLVIVRLHRTIPLNHNYHANLLCSSTIK